MPKPDRPKSLLKRVLPHVFVLVGLFVVLVVGVISGFATCASVAVIDGDLLPLGALLGMIVTAVVVVSIYRWSVRVGESIRDNG
jgi:hypothetical protein